jgi:hypothetical protein
MFQRSPLSLMGWLALLAALGSAGLAVVAFMLPSVDDAICPDGRRAHAALGAGGGAVRYLCRKLSHSPR